MKKPRFAFLFAALWAVMVPGFSFGADDQPEPDHPGLVKRKVKTFLSDDEKGDGRGIHLGPFAPRIEILSGGGPAGMLHFWTPDLGGSPIDIHASAAYSIHGYRYYDAQVGLVPHEGMRLPRVERGTGALFPLSELEKNAALGGFNIYASARFRDYPREDFYGLGPNSLKADHTDYRLKDGLYEGVIRFRLSSLSLMGRGGLLQTSIRPGTDSAVANTEGSNNEKTAPGLFRSPDFFLLSAAAWLELRDQPQNPHRGVSLGLAYSRFNDRRGDAFQFNRVMVDAREYLPLGSSRHVVALRQVTSLDIPDPGSSVPFYLQSSFGSSTFLRGYVSSRFRDDKLLALAGEYRFEASAKIELALLYEAGKVFSTMSDFDLNGMKRSFGVGIRLKSPQKVRLRVDVLRSSERTRVDVKLRPSF